MERLATFRRLPAARCGFARGLAAGTAWLALLAGGAAAQDEGGGAPPKQDAGDPKPPEAPKDEADAEPQDEGRLSKEEREARRAKRRAAKEAKAAKEAQAQKNKEEKPAPPQRWVDPTTIGADFASLPFSDVATDERGRRTQYDPLPEGVAFEVWLEGVEPRRIKVQEPDPAAPGQTREVERTVASLLTVSDAEWDEYYDYLSALTPPGNEAVFITVLLAEIVEQKAMMLHYRDELPGVAERAAAAVAKLKAGTPMRDVIRAMSEDTTSRSIDGLCYDDERGGLLHLYPLPKALFELEQGDISGPVFNKQAAYILMADQVTRSANMPWHDRVRAVACVFRYPAGKNLKSNQIAAVKAAARVRSTQPRFQRMLPPGLQMPRPASFGPADVAAAGDPDAPLQRRHIDDAKDQPPAGGR